MCANPDLCPPQIGFGTTETHSRQWSRIGDIHHDAAEAADSYAPPASTDTPAVEVTYRVSELPKYGTTGLFDYRLTNEVEFSAWSSSIAVALQRDGTIESLRGDFSQLLLGSLESGFDLDVGKTYSADVSLGSSLGSDSFRLTWKFKSGQSTELGRPGLFLAVDYSLKSESLDASVTGTQRLDIVPHPETPLLQRPAFTFGVAVIVVVVSSAACAAGGACGVGLQGA